MESVSKRILNYAVLHKYVDKEQYEEYVYMMTLVLNIIITDISTLIIGIAIHMVWECIVFWLIYKALRKYCGGFHFSTSFRCYLSTIIMCPIVLYIIKFVPISMVILALITSTATLVLLVLVPVEAVNKPLDKDETIVFGKVARILTAVAFIIFLLTALLNLYIIAKVMTLSIASVTVFVIAGKLHLEYLHKKSPKASV